MNFKELLKAQGLSDEQITAITGAMTKEKIYTTTEENIEERYSKLKGKKEDLEEQLKTATGTITELKKSNKDNEDLQAKVKEYETTIETLKNDSNTKIRNLSIDSAIDKLLIGAKHTELLKSQFDREKLEVTEDGTIKGLDEQFKGLKENYKDFFQTTVVGIDPNNKGGSDPKNEPEDLRGALAAYYK